jgi:tetratricopeptide (TPR) repeat protein
MSDVFVSYASDDRDRVNKLVAELEREGLSVWWDRQIDVGTTFDKEIETAVDEARCVVVIWSVASTQSNWVRAEAADGLERGVLVPVLFDDVRPPLLFRQIQACRLIDWPATRSSELERLLSSVKKVLADDGSSDKIESHSRPTVSVLLADIRNETDSELYSGSIDEALRMCLQEVPGIYIYARDQAVELLQGEPLDIEAATTVGAREGLDFIVGGRVRNIGSEFGIELEVRPLADFENVTRPSSRFEDQDSVARAVTELVGVLQNSLLRHDSRLEYFAESLTVANLEALRAYNLAQRMAAEERFEEAIEHYQSATQHDPDMGRAHGGWATAAYALGRVAVAREQWRIALKKIDRMTQQERLRTLGVYYALGSQNYEKAAETFRELLRRDPLDARALNNLSVVNFLLLDFDAALDSGRHALEVFPDSVLYRGNYALLAMYASDFETAGVEAEKVRTSNANFPLAYIPLAITALINNDAERAIEVYEQMGRLDSRAASIATAGKADLAMASRDWNAAVDLLRDGIETDRETGNTRAEAAKLLMLAECDYELENFESAGQRLGEARALDLDSGRLTTTASLLVRFGDVAAARTIGEELRSRLNRVARAYGHVVEAECLAAERKFGDAVDELEAASEMADVWYGHLVLSRVLNHAGHTFEAFEELNVSLRRCGEATAVYLDDVPTFRFVQQARKLRDQAAEAV